MTYTPYNADWKDFPDVTTPIVAAALNHIEGGIADLSYGGATWFVNQYLPVSGDGKHLGTGFKTFAEAIDAAADRDSIGIIAELEELITIDKGVRVFGIGMQPVMRAPQGSTSIDDILVHVTADHVRLENLYLLGGVTGWKGILCAVDGVSACTGTHLRIQGDAGLPTAYPTAPVPGTGVGGIGLLLHNGERHYFENLDISQCCIGLVGGVESSCNVFNRIVFIGNAQDLVTGLYTATYPAPMTAGPFPYQPGTGSATAGAWTITGVKSTVPQNIVGNPVWDLDADGCACFSIDLTEGGTDPQIKISGDGNYFARASSAPQSEWHITGNSNHFVSSKLLNNFYVSGHYNTFEGTTGVYGTFYGPGDNNTFRNVFFYDTAGQHLALTGVGNVFDQCRYYGHLAGGTEPTLANLGTSPKILHSGGVYPVTWTPPIVVDINLGSIFKMTATANTNFTISNPIDTSSFFDSSIVMHNGPITYDIKNSSGGAMGTITWDTAFLLSGAFTNPANGKRRTISFYYDGTNWVEINRASADI